MAYGNKYFIPWSSLNKKGYIYIDKKDYSDASTRLYSPVDTLEIQYQFDDYNSPIIGLSTSFEVLNTSTNFFPLLELLTNEEKQFKVKVQQVYPTSQNLFEGFLNVDNGETTYLHMQPLRLVASNYLKKLENTYPVSVDTIQKKTLLDLVSETLLLTGTDKNIKINSKLFPYNVDTDTSTKTLFNTVSVDTESFWKNNIERNNGLEILNQILTPVDCYLYWYDGYWYIERYGDFYDYPKTFVEYNINTHYGDSSNGTWSALVNTSTNISDLNLTNHTQTLSIIPGLKQIELKLNQEQYGNLIDVFPNYLTTTTAARTSASPNKREWLFGNTGGTTVYMYQGNYREMSRSVIMYDAFQTAKQGAYTSFRVTQDGSLTTALNVKFKFKPSPAGFMTTGSETTYDYRICYGLFPYAYGSTYIDYIEVPQDTLNQTTFVKEITIDKDLTDASFGLPGAGDYDFRFQILFADKRAAGTSGAWSALVSQYIGDPVITANQEDQDNVYYADLSTNFTNKKSIELDLFDSDNLNYKNCLYLSSNDETRTSVWTVDESTYYPLYKMLLYNKSQLLNRSRQVITSDVCTSTALRPLSLWRDSNQPSKQFILGDYIYYPTRDIYKCKWLEYDNNEQINFS